MQLVPKLRSSGFRLTAQGDQLLVEPKASLTDELRVVIRTNKAAILRELSHEAASAPPAAAVPLTVAQERDSAPMSPLQETARREVLAQLEAHPAVNRAFVNRFEPDGTMIITLGIRDVGTGELKIPVERFSQATLDDYGALLNTINGRHD